MSHSDETTSLPRSMRQKRILDAAADKPQASLEAIATEIPTATSDLVEETLAEYGDPAETKGDEEEDNSDGSAVPEPDPPDISRLTEKQREILELIAEHPDATQQEFADALDVSAATICTRVNSIEGFDWQHREEFVSSVLEPTPAQQLENTSTMETDSSDQHAENDSVTERLTKLEETVGSLDSAENSTYPFEDPDLAHKVMHACLDSEVISEDEELRILKAILS